MLGAGLILKFFKNSFSNASKKCIAYLVKSYKRTCPHISDFEPFASMYYFSGLHNYRPFYLLVTITEIFNINKYKRIYIIVNTDKYDFETDEIVTDKKNRIFIDQRVDIKIRQCDEKLYINLFTSKLTKKIHIGEIIIDIYANIILKSFPKKQWFVCFKDGQEVCKVQLSFYKVQKYACANECMFIQDGLEIWKNIPKDVHQKKKKKIDFNDIDKKLEDEEEEEDLSYINLDTDLNDISLIHKLKLLSLVLEQELYVFDFYAFVPKYMSAKEILGEWFLCFRCFKTEKEEAVITIESIIERNIHRDITIPMLNINRLVIDSSNNTDASIIYTYENIKYHIYIHSKKNLYYIIDAITIFTNELKILNESFVQEMESRKKKIIRNNTANKLTNKRRVTSPRLRNKLPQNTFKMIKEMYLDDGDGDKKREDKKDEEIDEDTDEETGKEEDTQREHLLKKQSENSENEFTENDENVLFIEIEEDGKTNLIEVNLNEAHTEP